jgi:hypothetical protein
VRQDSILARTAPADVVAWLDTLGLDAVEGVVDIPANSAIGIGPRICAPVRHEQTTLGYVWVIPGPTALHEDERALLSRATREAAATLWARRSAPQDAQIVAWLAALMDDPEPGARARAADGLAERQQWPAEAQFAIVLAVGASASEAAAAVRRRRDAGDVLTRAVNDGVIVLARTREPESAAAIASSLVRLGADRAAASQPFSLLSSAPAARSDAAAALLALTQNPALGRSATFAELGAWPSIARLWDASGRPAAPPPLTSLLEARHGAQLIEALEATLDAGGDVARAAESLGIHRATLYRRLQRASSVAGLDLSHGDDVLHAHLALRMWHLGR